MIAPANGRQPTRSLVGWLCALIASAAFLFVLHGAQPLAVRGPPLAPDSFATAQGAHYRIVLRSPNARPLTISLQGATGEVISQSVTLPATASDPNAKSWAILRALQSTDGARLVTSEGDARQFEIRLLDNHAPRRRQRATAVFFIFMAALIWKFRMSLPMQAVALGLAYFLFLLACDRTSFFAFTSDNRYYALTSMSVLANGDWDLDEFAQPDPAKIFASDYRVRRGRDGHFYNLYPTGTSLLALPIVAVVEWLNDQSPDAAARAFRANNIVAKVFCAASVSLFLLVVSMLTARRITAWCIALIFAFATPQLSTHGAGLWSHNTTVLCGVVALFLWLWRDGRWAGFAAIPLTLGCASRPTLAIAWFAFGGALLVIKPRQLVLFICISILGGTIFFAQSMQMWGTLLPPYYTGLAGASGSGISGYFGTLVSPNRGLFVFAPIFLFALVGFWRAFRHSGPQRIYLIAAFIVPLEWLAASRNSMWWGGHCYGPRLLCELLPFATLLLLPAWDFIAQQRWRTIALTMALFVSAWGLFTQLEGLTEPRVHQWNATPDVDGNTGRLWDWGDWQIFAAWQTPMP